MISILDKNAKPWNLPYQINSTSMSSLDPHPDFLWFSYENGERISHSIGTSLFLGPTVPRLKFCEKYPLYCPESVKWNRILYYSMDNPLLLDCLDETMLNRLKSKCVNESFDENNVPYESLHFPGVWSIWGKCGENCVPKCLDAHECVDIGYEIKFHHESLEEARMHDCNDEYFYTSTCDRQKVTLFGKEYEPGTLFSLERRSKAISNWKDLTVNIALKDLGGQPGDKFLRELAEAQFAWNNKAVYWNRSYFQCISQRMVKSQMSVAKIMSKI